ncbi:hypothetical protein CYLTODRAFT_425328, partial [Cylindrobasidium torrendii FP15055 ss-10]
MAQCLLDLNYDVLGLICRCVQLIPLSRSSVLSPAGKRTTAIKALSCTGKTLRAMCAPLLFEHIEISFSGNRQGVSFEDYIRDMQQGWSGVIAHSARSLFIGVFFGDPSDTSRQTITQFVAETIFAIPRLERLTVHDLDGLSLWDALNTKKHAFRLLSIRELALAQDQWRMIEACPNAQSLEVTEWDDADDLSRLIETAGLLPHLMIFSYHAFSDHEHTTVHLNKLAHYAPGLQKLVIGDGGGYNKGVIPGAGNFRQLKSLVLPSLENLGLGYRHPQNRNAFLGRHGNELRRKLRTHEIQLRKKLSQEAFQTCRSLQTLWIGESVKVFRPVGEEDYQYNI